MTDRPAAARTRPGLRPAGAPARDPHARWRAAAARAAAAPPPGVCTDGGCGT
ncbi:hypothetical protein [Streptomyces sp. KY75]|uniref:hypothetical protein n=1 Tax=Streptomyces sp. KY75 TaxID=2772433 RepID=UPI003FA6EC4B